MITSSPIPAARQTYTAAAVADPWTAAAAVRITSSTTSGCDNIGTWLESTLYVVAPIRSATKRSSSGFTVRSWVARIYQLGLDRHATPSASRLNRPASGTAWVAPTSG